MQLQKVILKKKKDFIFNLGFLSLNKISDKVLRPTLCKKVFFILRKNFSFILLQRCTFSVFEGYPKYKRCHSNLYWIHYTCCTFCVLDLFRIALRRHFSATVLALPNGIKNAMALYRFNVKRGTGIEDAKRAIAFRKGYLDTKLKDSFAVSNLTKWTSRFHS